MPGPSFLVFTSGIILAGLSAQAQTILTCQANANPLLVRGEGLTERMGDIVLQCSGGAPFDKISGNLTVFLSVPMTNRVDAAGYTDLSLTVDTGSGPVPAAAKAAYLNSAALSFSRLEINLSATGSALIRLSNLRGAANQTGVNSARQITAILSFNAGSLVSLSNNQFSVATVVRSLYSSYTSRLICTSAGTPPIGSTSINDALSYRAASATVRVSEGFNSAFGPRSDTNFQTGDVGTRIVFRFGGVPTGARLWVPDAVVGNDGVQPTSAGDYALAAGGGIYAPGTGTLLLIRIPNAASRGGGNASSPIIPRPTTTTLFDTINEVFVNNDGTGQVVYEVFDANESSVQNATIPTFLYLPAGAVQTPTQITQDVFLGATGTGLETNPTAVIPRFVTLVPPNDCSVVGDCGASYFPKLKLTSNVVDVTLTSLDVVKTQYVNLSNAGGGNFLWNAKITYTGGAANGYQWLKLSPTAGLNSEALRLDLVPGALPNGIYDALVTLDGGPLAGTAQIKVTMRYSYKAPTPVVINAVNAANQKPGTLVPGSAASILGDRLLGNKITVTFDDTQARILSSNSTSRLDVQVPYDQVGKQYSLIVVNVDGSPSTPGLLVPIGPAAPAIYPGSVANSDLTSNNPRNPAVAGSTIQMYATGLPVGGVYTGKIHDRTIDGDNLVYAGPAPTLIGVHLFTMIVPADLPTITTGVAVCGGPTAETQTCSDFSDLSIIAVPQP